MTKDDYIRMAMSECQGSDPAEAHGYLSKALNADDMGSKAKDRMEIAKAAMQGLLSNPNVLSKEEFLMVLAEPERQISERVSRAAVVQAEKLIAQLEEAE